MWFSLDKISNIHGHLLNGGVVECLNVPQDPLVLVSHHVNGYSLPAKTATPTNPERRQTAAWGKCVLIHVIQDGDMDLKFTTSDMFKVQLCKVWKYCAFWIQHYDHYLISNNPTNIIDKNYLICYFVLRNSLFNDNSHGRLLFGKFVEWHSCVFTCGYSFPYWLAGHS